MSEASCLRELFWELQIQERVFPKNPLYKKHAMEAEKILSRLTDSLPAELSALVSDYHDERASETAYYCEELFVLGFRYGARITREAFQMDKADADESGARANKGAG